MVDPTAMCISDLEFSNYVDLARKAKSQAALKRLLAGFQRQALKGALSTEDLSLLQGELIQRGGQIA